MSIISYKNLQHYRYTVHRYLDSIWLLSTDKGTARSTMYDYLSQQMQLKKEETHISKFTKKQCKQAIKILRPKYIQIYGRDLGYKSKEDKKEEFRMAKLSENKKGLKFLYDNKDLIKDLIEEKHYTYLDIVNYCSDNFDVFLQPWWVGEFARSNRMLAIKNNSYPKKQDGNSTKRTEAQQNIIDTVRKSWEEGVCKDSKFQEEVENYDDKKNMKHNKFDMNMYYKEKLEYYQPELVCECCGKSLQKEKYDIHHVDENYNNILLTNLEKLCVNCHQKYHLQKYKLPFVTVEISHELQYGHRLPGYSGKCYFDHGHRGIVTLQVKRRINPSTGFAVDFNDLKKVINEEIDKVLDHEYLNNYMQNPTTEFSVVWLWNKLSSVLKGLESISWAEGSKTKITLTKQDMNNSVKSGMYEVDWIPEEYREQLNTEINLDTDLPYIDESNNYPLYKLV